MKLAQEIAECSPLGLISTRATMRAGLADRVLAATNHELTEQNKLRATRGFQGRRQGHRRASRREFQGAVRFKRRRPGQASDKRARAGTHTPCRLVCAQCRTPSFITHIGGYGSRRSPGRLPLQHHQRIHDRDA